MRRIGLALVIGLGLVSPVHAAPTLDKVMQAGAVVCGVQLIPGFSQPDSQGKFTGFNVDICRAISAAIFGDPDKVKYVPLTPQQRFTALQSGEVDLLSNNTTWTLQRDTALGFDFGPIVFYDGQGFMVPKKLGVKSVRELSGATICVQMGTTSELNLADHFRANRIDYNPVVLERTDEVFAAYFSGRCDALTQDATEMSAHRASRAPNPEDHLILPERISKEPLAPVVRHGDNQWRDIVDWVIFALIEAEEREITRDNVEEMTKSDDPNLKRILGVTPGAGKALGLDERWAYNVIKAVGNYGEIFDRHLGAGSPLKVERGYNKLWTKGGLIYAPPIR